MCRTVIYLQKEKAVQKSEGKVNDLESVREMERHLSSIAAVAKDELAQTIAALAPGRLDPADAAVAQFVHDLLQCLASHNVSGRIARWLVGDLEAALNPGKGSIRQTHNSVRDFAHGLKVAGADHALADQVGADLKVLAPQSLMPDEPDVPAHKFRYALSEAPRYDRCVVVEDFEAGGNLWDTWYTPYWSKGIVVEFDAENKSSGKYGLTISNAGPVDNRSSVAKFPKPNQNLEGMNALRMWFRPYGQAPGLGTLSTGLIDGSDEIWQVDVPDVFTGTEPYILQIRLADIRRILRRNNRQLDLENRDFCLWFTGAWKFSVDDIMFVHDPDLPEFIPSPIQ